MLVIVDYQAGNQTSVSAALTSLGIPNKISMEPTELATADGVIFPGVGAAGQAMAQLRSSGLDRVIHKVVATGTPLLGICLGCQILLDYSEEGDTPTLGIIPGTTRRFSTALTDSAGDAIRIPHMGWNTAPRGTQSRIFDGIPQDASFYFVHSYYVIPPAETVLAVTEYGMPFCSSFGRDGLWAVQFHAEKSGPCGLRVLYNFYAFCRERSHAG